MTSLPRSSVPFVLSLGLVSACQDGRGTAKNENVRLASTKMQVLELHRITMEYHDHHGRMPASWQDLLVADEHGRRHLDSTEPPFDPWGHEYLLVRGEGAREIVVLSVGPDGKRGTDDDIDQISARRPQRGESHEASVNESTPGTLQQPGGAGVSPK